MSHSTVLVIGDNPEEQLAPFNEELEIEQYPGEEFKYNPQAKWDWYSLGGRWAGFFTLKTGAEGIQGHHRAKDFAALSGTTVEDLPVTKVDQAYKRDIDFEAMKAENIANAEKTWAKYEADTDHRQDAYWKYGVRKDETKEAYIKRRSSVSTFAVLKDGIWYERGDMGWWGMVNDEKNPGEWDEEFNKLLESVEPDTLLSIYDVHI